MGIFKVKRKNKMKYLINLSVFLMLLAFNQSSQAQVCEPDTQYTEEGVWPPPDNLYPRFSNPKRGVHKRACLNQPYNFTFTINVPDSADGDQYGQDGKFDLDWVRIDSITNLPPGIEFLCDPTDSVFQDDETGCVSFTGTPTDTGDFSFVLYATVRVNDFGGFLINDVTFPQDPEKLEFGEYIVRVLSEERCAVLGLDEGNSIQSAALVFPNPSTDIPSFSFKLTKPGIGKMSIYNTLGRKLHVENKVLTKGELKWKPEINLNSGIYFYQIETPEGKLSGQFLIN
ncbi:MAG: hypothetical protein ACI81S_000421 [Sphingobacteriales bacterium]